MSDLKSRILADLDSLQRLYSKKITDGTICAAEVANYIKLIKDSGLVWLLPGTGEQKPPLSIVEKLPFADAE